MLKALVSCVKIAGISCGRRGQGKKISRIVVEEIQQGKGNTKRHRSESESYETQNQKAKLLLLRYLDEGATEKR